MKDGQTVICKTVVRTFAKEADVLWHAAANGVPVPRLLKSSTLLDGRVAMLLEDLGDMPEQDPPLVTGARAAVAVHACPPMRILPVLDQEGLSILPFESLMFLDALQRADRWTDCDDVRESLQALDDAAPSRSLAATLAPFGMVHSEFYPTSLHTGPEGVRILDWARVFVGSGLLGLAGVKGEVGLGWRGGVLGLSVLQRGM